MREMLILITCFIAIVLEDLKGAIVLDPYFFTYSVLGLGSSLES